MQHTRQHNADIGDLLEQLEARAKAETQPCHYLFEFVDGDGLSPTPKEILQMVEVAEKYAGSDPRDWDTVERVDMWKPWNAFSREDMEQNGVRRYLQSTKAKRNLRTFLDNLKAFLKGEPQDQPLLQPLREAGYSKDGPGRISSHKSHNSSNYLMNLFEAIAAGVFGWDYRNKASIIYLCFEREQAAVGEIVWSCLAQAYTKTGRGFSHAPAGVTTTSADRDDLRWLKNDAWVKWQRHALDHSPFRENREDDQKRVSRAWDERNRRAAELENLKVRMRRASLGDSGEAASDSQEDPDVATLGESIHELRGSLEAGGFESQDGREMVEDIVRFHMTRELVMMRTLAAEQARILQVTEEIKARSRD